MTTYSIQHHTHYRYQFPVSVSHHSTHLQPRSDGRQRCHRFALNLQPESVDLSERVDFFGNTVHFFSLQDLHDSFEVDATSEVSLEAQNPPIPEITPTCSEIRSMLSSHSRLDLIQAGQFCHPSPMVPGSERIRAFAAPFFVPDQPILAGSMELCREIHKSFQFDATATDISTPVEQFFENRRGVCQDFAHLALTCLRSHGLPARYVSGYILTHPPPGQPRLQGADASHAWIAVHVPGYGWVDIDPTNYQIVSDEHITVAYGRDYSDVSVVRGAMLGGGEHEIEIAVTVSPVQTSAS